MLQQDEINRLVLIGAFLALVPGYVFLASRGAITMVRRFRGGDAARPRQVAVYELASYAFQIFTALAVFGTAIIVSRWIEQDDIVVNDRWLPLLMGAGASSITTTVLGLMFSVAMALWMRRRRKRHELPDSGEGEVVPAGYVRLSDYSEISTMGIEMLVRPLTPPSGGRLQRIWWRFRRWANENEGLGHWMRAAFAALGAAVTLQGLFWP